MIFDIANHFCEFGGTCKNLFCLVNQFIKLDDIVLNLNVNFYKENYFTIFQE